MNKFIRIFLSISLLIIGFFVGIGWNNSDSTQTATAPIEPAPANYKIPSELPTDLNAAEKSLIKCFEVAAPSVVFITTSQVKRDYWTRNVYEIPSGTGSGFFWDKEGHVITNYHVVKGASKAEVILNDHTTYSATLVGAAPEKDLAVLKIDAPKRMLYPIPVAKSDNLLVGQSVLAIGNPFGLDQTLTTGIISALGREINSDAGVPIRDVIQTDAAINPGNSGGPLLNSSGQLIGVNTAIYSPSGAYAGIGFSIPADVVSWVVPELIKYGKVQRPSLGVELANASVSERFGLKGALIIDVQEGSGAAKAGIQPTYRDQYGRIRLGDVITAINGDKIENSSDLILALEKYKAGETVKVKILRQGEKMNEELTLNVVLDKTR